MNEPQPRGDEAAAMPDAVLHDLIASHFDGALDADGQRRLARQIALSPASRRVLASFLRIEAATMRLALAGQFGAALDASPVEGLATATAVDRGVDAGVDAGVDGRPTGSAAGTPYAAGATTPARARRSVWPRVATIALAGSLLAAVVLVPRFGGWVAPDRPMDGDMDRLADEWLRVARIEDADASDSTATAARPPDASLDESEAGPPAWLVAAMGDADVPRLSPDPG